MPSPRRRPALYRGYLNEAEELWFHFGVIAVLPDLPRFYRPGRGVDEAAARALWHEHRDRFMADWDASPTSHTDATGTVLVPFAAVRFDGDLGEWDPYRHISPPR